MRKVKQLSVGRKDLYMVILLFLLAFSLRYYFKSAGLWHTDSVIGARAAEDTLATGRLHYLQGRLGYPGEAILTTLTYAAFKMFGAESAEFSTIFAGILFGALCSPIIYLLAKKLFDSEYVAAYSAIILAFLPVHLSLSTFGKGHGMEMFFLMLSAYLSLLAGERKTLNLKLAASLSLGFTMAIRQTSALLFPAFILLYWRGSPPLEISKRGKQANLKLKQSYAGVAADVAALVILAFIIFALSFAPKMMGEPAFSLPGELQSVSEEANVGFSLFSPMLKLSLEWATISLTYLGWLLFLVGIAVTWRKDRYLTLTLVIWFLSFFMYLGNLISTSPRFVIPALAIPVMFSAAAIDAVRLKYNKFAAGVVIFLLVSWMMYNIYPVLDYRRIHCGPCDFSKKIAEATEKNAVIIAMDESQHYEYYANRSCMGHPGGRDLLDQQKIDENLGLVEGLLRNGTPVYATTQGLFYDIYFKGLLGYDRENMTLINMQSGRRYGNLKYDAGRGELYDVRTNTVFPLTGVYELELFNRFSVKPVFQMENEDWHHSDVAAAIYPATLYKISLRGGVENAG